MSAFQAFLDPSNHKRATHLARVALKRSSCISRVSIVVCRQPAQFFPRPPGVAVCRPLPVSPVARVQSLTPDTSAYFPSLPLRTSTPTLRPRSRPLSSPFLCPPRLLFLLSLPFLPSDPLHRLVFCPPRHSSLPSVLFPSPPVRPSYYVSGSLVYLPCVARSGRLIRWAVWVGGIQAAGGRRAGGARAPYGERSVYRRVRRPPIERSRLSASARPGTHLLVRWNGRSL